jgi:hypothetical protein
LNYVEFDIHEASAEVFVNLQPVFAVASTMDFSTHSLNFANFNPNHKRSLLSPLYRRSIYTVENSIPIFLFYHDYSYKNYFERLQLSGRLHMFNELDA